MLAFKLIALLLIGCALIALSRARVNTDSEDDRRQLQMFHDGDIPASWLELISNDLCKYDGLWKVVPSKSGKLDRLMSALDFGWIKRKVAQFHKSVTELDLSSVCSPTPLSPFGSSVPSTAALNITSYLPMKTIKNGYIPLNGKPFELDDSDTGIWNCTAAFINGRLLQRRVSQKYGVLYDTRVLFEKVNLKNLHLADEYFEQQNEDHLDSLVVREEIASNALNIDDLVQVLRMTLYPNGDSIINQGDSSRSKTKLVVNRYNTYIASRSEHNDLHLIDN